MKKVSLVFCVLVVFTTLSVNVLITTGECLVDTSLNFTQILATAQSESGGGNWYEEMSDVIGRGFSCECYPMPGGGTECLEEICDFRVYTTWCYSGGKQSCYPGQFALKLGNCSPTGGQCN